MAPSQKADTTEISTADPSLYRNDTNASIAIPKDVFEKLYLTPQLPAKGQLRATFGNPTPLGLVGFIMTSSPFACILMGWRGASDIAALIGVLYFFGGTIQIIACILEFFLANTFPCVVFGTFGAFWLSLGITEQYVIPQAADPTNFYASFAYVLAFFGVLMLMFLVCALRTNVIFVTLFALIIIIAELLAAAYWSLADGAVSRAENLLKGAGAVTFILSAFAFYLLFTILLEAVDFPLTLPVGDLSTRFKGKRGRKAEKERRDLGV
ncbi:uncharacterized protein Z520_10060 [Fonsecaea multimorphosa CBS 102226]|uniref:GPR1/FUN34/YaaH-class plasma membrane protein n=1 Tax=Fonsecaea multimorphosa CBS 102226 TaxID=1442371 RepID=A0A0D2GXT2_9EURO|nr:uncharacterized protein Z520_10060 [Fonsecaea multimorphosa CBS 102226]KIX94350.1 hypothetical protein Z520_10060 [Fonsecaea multimorphosa CBS 102226]OAL19682.1 hypothetical protein AYO22_09554 [Fonsecaea multimorphosa]